MAGADFPVQLPLSALTLDRLLGALPELGELVSLRQALLSASSIDAGLAWSRAQAYATYDKRVLTPEALQQALTASAQSAHTRIDELYAALSQALYAVAADDWSGAAGHFLAAGQRHEADEATASAIIWYQAADRMAERGADRAMRALALRRLAHAHLSQGATDEALAYYHASFEQAAAAEDVESQIVAGTGLGNVAGYQGRFRDAVVHFTAALELCGAAFPRRRALLLTNMASMLSEEGALQEASDYLAHASALWSDMSPADQAIWYNSRGRLALERGEIELAEGILHQALEVAGSEFERAMVLDNLAELFVRQGNLSEADSLARSAEEAALRAGSPRALAEIYTRLGKIYRLRADANGVTFFEKAVEICRSRRYPHTEANAYLEYGLFRRQHGDLEEARSYIERARDLFSEIGADQLGRTAAELLLQP